MPAEPTEPVFALLYQSSAAAGVDGSELHDILQTAVTRNAALGVTGLLLYGQMELLPGVPGLFSQWLEGPEAHVRDLYARIARDPRHTQVHTIADGPAVRLTGKDERLFPAWAMEMRRLADVPATLEGFLAEARRATPVP